MISRHADHSAVVIDRLAVVGEKKPGVPTRVVGLRGLRIEQDRLAQPRDGQIVSPPLGPFDSGLLVDVPIKRGPRVGDEGAPLERRCRRRFGRRPEARVAFYDFRRGGVPIGAAVTSVAGWTVRARRRLNAEPIQFFVVGVNGDRRLPLRL